MANGDDDLGISARRQRYNKGINITNHFGVGTNREKISVLLRVRDATPDQALTLAAWIVCVASHNATHTFDDVLKAVRGH